MTTSKPDAKLGNTLLIMLTLPKEIQSLELDMMLNRANLPPVLYAQRLSTKERIYALKEFGLMSGTIARLLNIPQWKVYNTVHAMNREARRESKEPFDSAESEGI